MFSIAVGAARRGPTSLLGVALAIGRAREERQKSGFVNAGRNQILNMPPPLHPADLRLVPGFAAFCRLYNISAGRVCTHFAPAILA
jgi:hypothetical protein